MSTQLEALLDQTRDALITGNFADLSRLAGKVGDIADSLPRLDHPTADRLRQKADRNARLLQAAQCGIRAARQRINEINAGPSLSTYDAHGRREVIQSPSLLVTKRV